MRMPPGLTVSHASPMPECCLLPAGNDTKGNLTQDKHKGLWICEMRLRDVCANPLYAQFP